MSWWASYARPHSYMKLPIGSLMFANSASGEATCALLSLAPKLLTQVLVDSLPPLASRPSSLKTDFLLALQAWQAYVHSMITFCFDFAASPMLSSNRQVTEHHANASSDPKVYFTAVRELLGMLTSEKDWEGALLLCGSAVEQLEEQQLHQDPKWAADWVWLAVQQAMLKQQTLGVDVGEDELRKFLQLLQKDKAHKHLISYCSLSLANVLLARGNAYAWYGMEAGVQIDAALRLAEESAVCNSVWLPAGASPQPKPQLALKALALLAKLEQLAARLQPNFSFRGDPPLQVKDEDIEKAATVARRACIVAFGSTSKETHQVSKGHA